MSRYRELTEHLKGLEDIRAILAGIAPWRRWSCNG